MPGKCKHFYHLYKVFGSTFMPLPNAGIKNATQQQPTGLRGQSWPPLVQLCMDIQLSEGNTLQS